MLIILLVALLLLLAGLGLQWYSRRRSHALGLPAGEIVYSDTGAWQAVAEPIISYRYSLVGKPDYLVAVRAAGTTCQVPVEVKSGNHLHQPRTGHLLQLGAYCLLVEEQTGVRPPYGLLHYADGTRQIPYSDELREAVITAIAAIQAAQQATDVARSHTNPARCQSCGYRQGCGKAALV